MGKTKTASTETKRSRTRTTAKAPINARRVGAKTLALAILARGEPFGREVWTHWEGMRASAQRTTQVEPRATH